ncbi:MAG TPA: hypothetical protein VEI03_17840 [Stellaceae bacterium]|nr:hypothetical protein [Stellaceae bacterium]
MPNELVIAEAGLRRSLARLIPALPLLVGLAAFARALLDRRSLLNDPDTYLHIAAGRWLLAHGALPAQDPFSHSMAGAPWVVHEWLAEGVLAFLYDGLGWSGPVLAAAACFALSLALLERRLLPHLGSLPSLIAVALGASLVLPHLLARPHILALPLLVVWSAAIIDARDKAGAPPFRALPVMALWANLHGGFMVGVALAALAAVEATLDRRGGRPVQSEAGRWGLFLLLTILAATLTPNGVAGFMLPFRIIGMSGMKDSFSEWMSPDFHGFQPLEIWLLGLMLLGFSLGLKLPLPRLVLLLGLVHLALQQGRQGELLGLIGPLAIAASLGRQLPTPGAGRTGEAAARRASAPVIASIVAIGLALGAMTLLDPLQRTDDRISPASALAAAQRMGLSGPVLNSEPFGGYLIFRGVPTFIDGRMEMYGDRFLRRYLDADAGSGPALLGLLRDYAIAWTLLEPSSRATEIMDHLPGWRRVYADAYAVVHARTEDFAR